MNKSFWKRPEGVTGFLFIGFVFFLLYTYLHTILSLLTHQTGIIVFFVFFTLLVYIVVDASLRQKAWTGFQQVMRSITALFIQLEDTSSAEGLVKNLENALHSLEKLLNDLTTVTTALKDKIDVQAIKNPHKSILFKPQKGTSQKSLKIQYIYGKLEELNTLIYQKGENGVGLYRQLKEQMEEGLDKLALKELHKQYQPEITTIKTLVEVSTSFLTHLDLKKNTFDSKLLEYLETKIANNLSSTPSKSKNNTIQHNSSGNATAQKKPLKDSDDNKYKDLFNF